MRPNTATPSDAALAGLGHLLPDLPTLYTDIAAPRTGEPRHAGAVGGA